MLHDREESAFRLNEMTVTPDATQNLKASFFRMLATVDFADAESRSDPWFILRVQRKRLTGSTVAESRPAGGR
ncbi:MAG: hypothetical protein LBK73_05215 [Treponema sp.]|jgi:hypothetical protein|nr:hypothetical protein [Treponema sp.]